MLIEHTVCQVQRQMFSIQCLIFSQQHNNNKADIH